MTVCARGRGRTAPDSRPGHQMARPTDRATTQTPGTTRMGCRPGARWSPSRARDSRRSPRRRRPRPSRAVAILRRGARSSPPRRTRIRRRSRSRAPGSIRSDSRRWSPQRARRSRRSRARQPVGRAATSGRRETRCRRGRERILLETSSIPARATNCPWRPWPTGHALRAQASANSGS